MPRRVKLKSPHGAVFLFEGIGSFVNRPGFPKTKSSERMGSRSGEWFDYRRMGASETTPTGEPEVQAGQRFPQSGGSLFCEVGVRPPKEMMVPLVDQNRTVWGVEPLCDALPIAPSHTTKLKQGKPILAAFLPVDAGTKTGWCLLPGREGTPFYLKDIRLVGDGSELLHQTTNWGVLPLKLLNFQPH